MRDTSIWVLAGSTIASTVFAVPAAKPDDTSVTFTLRSGGLAIFVPEGSPGTVQVIDLHGANDISWTATVSVTSFSAAGAPAVPAPEAIYSGGSGTTTWTPTLRAAIPFAATYGGTVTHSVA